ncbi:Hypothetical protein A7982_00240 [Minicystis rosea]|nr:Hypothetical protein A7982_00240 [Minicystis rosea]
MLAANMVDRASTPPAGALLSAPLPTRRFRRAHGSSRRRGRSTRASIAERCTPLRPCSARRTA